MKIESITLREIHMPLLYPFVTSFGKEIERHILLVTVRCEGVTGWGECVASEHPYYSEECVATAAAVMRQELIPALLGHTLERASDCVPLFARVRGNRMAKGALENALWEAEACAKKVPLWKLLGGTRSEIACGVSIGLQESLDRLEEKVAVELAAGYQRIKLKCKPGMDVALFERIRNRWPNILLSCDANSAYTLADAEHLKTFDRFDLLMIEQPLWHDDIYNHSKLQKQIKTRICLDEAIRNARDAEAAIELGACGIVNVKVGRVGGFTEAVKVHDVAQKHGIPVWCGGMLESGIGRAQNVHLSSLPDFTLPGDVSASKRYWAEDIIEPEVTVSGKGTIAVPDVPGTGYRVNEDLIERLTIKKETF
ncbi:MAG: o-succinylbenzoate synthase [Acidobacteriales bacterium]|nr:o-succinylbenzoate synthase [Terriglobales bacterium]